MKTEKSVLSTALSYTKARVVHTEQNSFPSLDLVFLQDLKIHVGGAKEVTRHKSMTLVLRDPD